MQIPSILLLGNPQLRIISEAVKKEECSTFKPIIQDLHNAMMNNWFKG